MSKESPSNIYPDKVDLNNCDKEPIHLIRKIQSHGFLIAVQIITQTITRCSENCPALFHKEVEQLWGLSISELLPEPVIDSLFDKLDTSNANYTTVKINNATFEVVAHLSDDEFILEFEIIDTKPDALVQQLMLTKFISNISSIKNSNQLYDYMVNIIKTHFGYDRVMILQFDSQWNGSIVAEAREEHLTSWLGLHYPSTDIPVPARRLFYFEATRIVKDVYANSIPIRNSPEIEKELDLSRSELRAVSPIHIEYLTNMKVGATLNVSVVSDKSVWGVILCHHYSQKTISYTERIFYRLLAKFFANQVQINKADKSLKIIKSSSLIRGKLIDQIIESWNIKKGLSQYKYTINDLTESEGAAIYIRNEFTVIGKCPAEAQIVAIIQRIKEITNDHLYFTNSFIQVFPEAKSFKEVASGVICLFISEARSDALLWFKPEVKETVYWAGKPQDKSSFDANTRISPRKSFEKWKQTQDGISSSWKKNEIAVVKEFRKNILNFIAQKYDEIKSLNIKLKKAYEELESFSYSISHDLRAPLRGIDGFAQIIKEDYYDSLDEFGKSSIETIINSVHKMNMLIDDILSYSSLDQKKIQYQKVVIEDIFREEIATFSTEYPKAKIVINTSLPDIYGDPSVITLLVRNLLDNALKYSARQANPEVSIGVKDKDTFYIQDNGIGFEQKNSTQIFKVFNRLSNDNFKGTGIGLSIAKRVIIKHKGKIWAESQPGKGATFYFKLNQEDE